MANVTVEDISPSSLPGVHFVYDSGVEKIQQQEKLTDSLDVKMGVLIGFLATFIVALLVAAVTSEASKVTSFLWWPTKAVLSLGIMLTGACLYFAFQAFKPLPHYEGIPFRNLIEWATEEPGATKEAFLPLLLGYVDVNDHNLKRKQVWARRAIISVFVALVALWISLVILAAQLLTGRV